MKTIALLVTLFSTGAFAAPTLIVWNCKSVDGRSTIRITRSAAGKARVVMIQTNSVPPMPTPPYRGTFRVQQGKIKYSAVNLETRSTLMMIIDPKAPSPNTAVQFDSQDAFFEYNCVSPSQNDSTENVTAR